MTPTTFDKWRSHLAALWNYVPIYHRLLSRGLENIHLSADHFIDKVKDDVEFARRLGFPKVLEPEIFRIYETDITEYFTLNSEKFASGGERAVRVLASVAHFVKDLQNLGVGMEFIPQLEYLSLKSDLDSRLAGLHSTRLTRLTTGALAIIARRGIPDASTAVFSSSCAITPLLRTRARQKKIESGVIYLLYASSNNPPLVYFDIGHQHQIEFFDDDLESKELEKLLDIAEDLANKEGKLFSSAPEARQGYLIQTLTSRGYLPFSKMTLEEVLRQVNS